MKRLYLGLTINIILLTGCFHNIPNPTYKPATYGILENSQAEGPTKLLLGGSDRNIAIILSENTKSSIEWLKKSQEINLKDSKNVLLGYEEEYKAKYEAHNPALIINKITKTLQTYFGQVNLITNTSEFNTIKNQYLVVIDIYKGWDQAFEGGTAISDIQTIFFDIDKKYANTAKSKVRERLYEHSGEAIHQVYIKSLEVWEAELSKIVKIDQKSEFNFVECMRTANSMKEKSLKSKAIEFCINEKSSSK